MKGLACAILLAGLGLPTAARPEEPEPECLYREPVVEYLERVQGLIFQTWALPSDMLANREVVIRLRIDADGMLLAYELVSFSDRRLAQSVKHAVMRASPFPPVPRDATCVVGQSIQTTFSNPEATPPP